MGSFSFLATACSFFDDSSPAEGLRAGWREEQGEKGGGMEEQGGREEGENIKMSRATKGLDEEEVRHCRVQCIHRGKDKGMGIKVQDPHLWDWSCKTHLTF